MFPTGTFAPAGRHLAPLLRGIVLIGQPALGLRLDLRSIGLGALGSRYQFVVGSCVAMSWRPRANAA